MRHVSPVLLWGPSVFAVVFSLIVVVLIVVAVRRAPPIQYSEEAMTGGSAPLEYKGTLAYEPGQAVYAPGEILEYTPTLTIAHGGALKTIRTLWDTQDRRARDCAGQVVPSALTEASVPLYISGALRGNVATYPVPNIPSGEYILSTTVVAPDGGQSSYIVRFDVERPCGG